MAYVEMFSCSFPNRGFMYTNLREFKRKQKLTYENRLRKLKLPTLTYRQVRGDMIDVYKFLSGK